MLRGDEDSDDTFFGVRKKVSVQDGHKVGLGQLPPGSVLNVHPRATAGQAAVWSVLSLRASKFAAPSDYPPAKVAEFVIMLSLVTSVVSAMLDKHSLVLSAVLSAFFSVEYGLRCWSCVAGGYTRLRWARKPLSILDLLVSLAILSEALLLAFDVCDLRASSRVRSVCALGACFRLLAILRIERQSKGFRRLRRVLAAKGAELAVAASIGVTLLAVFSVAIFLTDETCDTLAECVYYVSMTMTTVGYGDITPKSDLTKLFASIVAFSGVAFFALPSGIVASGFISIMIDEADRADERDRRRHNHKSKGRSLRFSRRASATPSAQSDDHDDEMFHDGDDHHQAAPAQSEVPPVVRPSARRKDRQSR